MTPRTSGVERFAAKLLAAASLAWSSPAAASDTRVQVRVDYEAPVGCPDRTDVLSLVRARRPDVTVTDDASEPRRLAIAVRTAESGYEGEVASYQGTQRLLLRRVDAASCKEVADALAFIAAVAADAPPPDEAPAPARAEDRDAAKPTSSPASLAPTTSRWSGSASAAGEIASIGAEDPLLGFRAAFAVARVDPGVLTPSFRVSIAQTLEATVAREEGAAHFRWTTGRLEVCPLRWSPVSGWRIRPCAGLETGFVVAQGDLQGEAHRRLRPWFAVAGAVSVSWEFAAPVSLELDLGAVVPLQRDEFFFQSNTVVYVPPVVEPKGSAGVSLRFW
jgi:hypothetical protein